MPLSDDLVERVARAIWEDQRFRIRDQAGINARLSWNSDQVPGCFWESYRADARAAIGAAAHVI